MPSLPVFDMDKKKVGVFIQDDAYGIDGREGAVRALRSHGLELAAHARVFEDDQAPPAQAPLLCELFQV